MLFCMLTIGLKFNLLAENGTDFKLRSPIVLNTTVTNTCGNGSTGSIDLTVSGGTPGYTYNCGGGITTEDRNNLAAGAYTVTGTSGRGTKSLIVCSDYFEMRLGATKDCSGLSMTEAQQSISSKESNKPSKTSCPCH